MLYLIFHQQSAWHWSEAFPPQWFVTTYTEKGVCNETFSLHYFFTLSNLICAHAQQPAEEKLTKKQAQQYFRLLAFLPVIGNYRTVQIKCSDLYPENIEEYESYFKKGNYEYFERRLKNAIPDLVADSYFGEKRT